MQARLRDRVRRLIEARAAGTAGFQTDQAAFQQSLDALQTRVRALELDLGRMRSDSELWSQPFSGSMTIDQAWRRHPGARAVFAAVHLPSCDTCAVRFDETIAEAAVAYGIDEEAFLASLNDLIAGT